MKIAFIVKWHLLEAINLLKKSRWLFHDKKQDFLVVVSSYMANKRV